VRAIAIDWSGARTGAKRKIVLAEAVEGEIVRIEAGRSREQVCDHLIELSARSEQLVVGFDFAFSLPHWFLREKGVRSAPELWALAAREAEEWLAAKAPPFWGGGRGPRPELQSHYRRSDLLVPKVSGIAPKSVFQAGGSGSVGTGSLRGMTVLHRLHEAGFSVWPFRPVALPLVVELYPRLLTGPVNKSKQGAREVYLRSRDPALPADMAARAAASEDAFDAAVSALVMSAHMGEILRLPPVCDPVLELEGVIWYPGWKEALDARKERQ
jgi:hypothetical protein